MTEQEEQKLIIRLSGHFLSEHLEDDFFELDDDKQMEYIKEYAWEPFEYHDPEDVYDLISSLAYDVMDIMKKAEENKSD